MGKVLVQELKHWLSDLISLSWLFSWAASPILRIKIDPKWQFRMHISQWGEILLVYKNLILIYFRISSDIKECSNEDGAEHLPRSHSTYFTFICMYMPTLSTNIIKAPLVNFGFSSVQWNALALIMTNYKFILKLMKIQAQLFYFKSFQHAVSSDLKIIWLWNP